MMSRARSRGTTSIRTGERPSDCSASICSVTTIEPSSAEIAAPERPATTTPVSIGPSSRAIVNATPAPTKFPGRRHGLVRGLERKHHAGGERGQEHDARRLDPQTERLIDRLAHADAQLAENPALSASSIAAPPAYEKNSVVSRPKSSSTFMTSRFPQAMRGRPDRLDPFLGHAAFGHEIVLALVECGQLAVDPGQLALRVVREAGEVRAPAAR